MQKIYESIVCLIRQNILSVDADDQENQIELKN